MKEAIEKSTGKRYRIATELCTYVGRGTKPKPVVIYQLKDTDILLCRDKKEFENMFEVVK